MDRMSLDLGTARVNMPVIMKKWKYIFVGECTGNVTIKLGSITASALDPNEFEKITGIEDYYFLFVNNAGGQTGKVLNIYFEEAQVGEDVEIEKD
jgi:hypothetical protein